MLRQNRLKSCCQDLDEQWREYMVQTGARNRLSFSCIVWNAEFLSGHRRLVEMGRAGEMMSAESCVDSPGNIVSPPIRELQC